MNEEALVDSRWAELDATDALRGCREQFLLPETDGRPDVYFVGNSLGLQPKRTQAVLQMELDRWRQLGVRGHFQGEPSWIDYPEAIAGPMAEIVGARADEVVVMNTLTVNLHLMLATFYQPQGSRRKVLLEQHAFPSDYQAVQSHLQMRGATADDLIVLEPDQGQWLFTTEGVCDAIRRHRDSLALILLPGIQYYSGQVLDMQAIARVARELEIPIGFDLAHAAGNIPLQLHEWAPDFACWCTYKYLNSGPGALGGCFIPERHAANPALPRLAGWWGHERESRFEMRPEFEPTRSASGWQLSNPPILSLAGVRASLQVFAEAGGMGPLREKSLRLGGYFRELLAERLGGLVRVVTPDDLNWAGCQLSLEIHSESCSGRTAFEALESAGIRTDWREPNVIRAAPVPLYNLFFDVARFVTVLERILVER